MHRKEMLAGLEEFPGLGLDANGFVIGHIAGDLRGQDAIHIYLSIFV